MRNHLLAAAYDDPPTASDEDPPAVADDEEPMVKEVPQEVGDLDLFITLFFKSS